MEGFSAEQASHFTGSTAHQLRYWDRVGLVKPSVQATRGRPGVRRLYSFRDLVALRVVRSLLDGGMSLQRVRRAYEYLRKKADLDGHLSEIKLVTDGASIFKVCRDDGEVLDALKEGQMAFFVELGDIVRSVDGRVAQYAYDRDEFIQALERVESGLGRERADEQPVRAARETERRARAAQAAEAHTRSARLQDGRVARLRAMP